MEHVNDYNLAITAAAGTCTTTIEKEGRFKKDTVDIQLRQAIPVPPTSAGWSLLVLAKTPLCVRSLGVRVVPKAELDRSESSWTVVCINFAFVDHDL